MIEICAIGGYLEIGRNLTAIKYKDEVIILDMGIHLENYIAYTEDEDVHDFKYKDLKNCGAAPDITKIESWVDQVKAIVPSHGHLDHIGAIPFLARKFKNAQILITPYSEAILGKIVKDNKLHVPNKIKILSDNSTFEISENITIELINVTHSIPDSVMVAIHTPSGTVLYTGDFKFDKTPTIGKTSNIQRLKELENVKVLIMDSLYSQRKGYTPSEKDAQNLLNEIIDNNGKVKKI